MDGDDLGAPAPVATPLPRATGKACIGPDLDATATVYKTSTSGSDPLTIIAVTKMTAGRCTLAGQPGVVAAHGTLPVWAAGPHPLPAVGVAGVEQPTTIDKGEQALVTIVADHRCASSGS